ncbi:MAG: hypothetical protein UU77_C0003G0006 [candidate division WWE3 bacterium GW2011_GWC1_41_7]|jgi:signal transduction histidine kinase|uniref:Signal transduction histidine kinase dimerisation/phosphoacceptor domain-containing protein n=4 Tax=Katanobacteria TaxID=422282 RepID=A0A0G1A7S1_UNCKA|nr:MAG: hypothetical protein UU72_C0010G0002 [candidate division WWE3 bacterium GW2011_GWB1_41_6]KKS21378.1 MAG: hypothetical protein UU77_C0003G0006 [candidate division WWE3 bacterium GW2011_GWC1_41_7]KKS22171.1 MAG: hypothetical protein UU80_C0012G0010 [candidate division WWE3 bacterium GW2011_GWA1_41_8]OGC57774.1 MAG: hypothetical protein A2976_03730 [candidate division WWE3 bacterium RIFCSPLOWO2_01_FULL_41_9]
MSDINIKKIRDLLHNVNSPITTIMGYSELIQRKYTEGNINDPEKVIDWIKAIHGETLRIRDYVKDISEEVSEIKEE